MQKQQSYLKSASLRFKRWSRKRYAAFVSLHQEVTIGNLAVHVSNRILLKQNDSVASEHLLDVQFENNKEEEHDALVSSFYTTNRLSYVAELMTISSVAVRQARRIPCMYRQLRERKLSGQEILIASVFVFRTQRL